MTSHIFSDILESIEKRFLINIITYNSEQVKVVKHMEMKANPQDNRAGKQLLALGELLIDLIPGTEGMRMEDAGPVIKTASGSAGIVACAMAELGGNGGFIGKVGHDSLSRLATSTLTARGVDMSHVVVSDEGQIGLAFLEYLPEGRNYQYYRNNSVGSVLRPEELDEDYIAGAYAVHYPGMLLELTSEMRGSCLRMVEIAREHGVLVSFDPNIRREIASSEDARQRLMDAVRSADIVAPTLDEGRLITGETTIGNVLRALHAMGPRVVALTRDADGAVLSRDGQVAIAHGIPINAIDPTGAGDSFAAALCVGLQEDMPLEKLACFCNCTGSLVCTKKGAIGMALPSRAQVEEMMASGMCTVELTTLDTME